MDNVDDLEGSTALIPSHDTSLTLETESKRYIDRYGQR